MEEREAALEKRPCLVRGEADEERRELTSCRFFIVIEQHNQCRSNFLAWLPTQDASEVNQTVRRHVYDYACALKHACKQALLLQNLPQAHLCIQMKQKSVFTSISRAH